jgi:hypothetical protein
MFPGKKICLKIMLQEDQVLGSKHRELAQHVFCPAKENSPAGVISTVIYRPYQGAVNMESRYFGHGGWFSIFII